MSVHIQDEAVERLIEQLSAITSESPAEVVRRALAERLAHIEEQAERRERVEGYLAYLNQAVWPNLPTGELRRVLTRDEEDHILGYGSDGS